MNNLTVMEKSEQGKYNKGLVILPMLGAGITITIKIDFLIIQFNQLPYEFIFVEI